ncbi:MAG: dTMP kinase [Candidatus Anstonellales archaeon]
MPLIIFEGIDGSGKATQIQLLSSFLKSRKIKFSIHKYPTKKASKIHTYLSGKSKLPLRTVFFLYLLDILLNQQKINRELEEDRIVILDRYITSTIAYSRSISFKEAINIISSFPFCTPDVIILLDVDVATSQSRKKKQKLHLDTHESNFNLLTQTRKNYKKLYTSKFLTKKWIKIDGAKDKQEIHSQIIRLLRSLSVIPV